MYNNNSTGNNQDQPKNKRGRPPLSDAVLAQRERDRKPKLKPRGIHCRLSEEEREARRRPRRLKLTAEERAERQEISKAKFRIYRRDNYTHKTFLCTCGLTIADLCNRARHVKTKRHKRLVAELQEAISADEK